MRLYWHGLNPKEVEVSAAFIPIRFAVAVTLPAET